MFKNKEQDIARKLQSNDAADLLEILLHISVCL